MFGSLRRDTTILCSSFKSTETDLIFAFSSPKLAIMFNLPDSARSQFTVKCKGCGENIPVRVQTMPNTWVSEHCPICGSYRRYLPNEIFQGRLSHKLTQWSDSAIRGGMPVQVNFRLQQNQCRLQCNSDDSRTRVSPEINMKSLETLFRLLKYVGATNMDIATVKTSMRKWGQGSIRINLTPGRKNLLRIRPPWNEGLLEP